MKKNIIEVTLKGREDYINRFHDKKISPELSEYILNECKAFKPREKIEIHIITDKMNDEERNELVDMIRENYGLDIQEALILAEKTNVLNLWCILIGVFFLFLSISLNKIFVISEVLLIFGWVPIWEAMYNMLFGGLQNRLMIKRLKRLTNCQIVFKEKNS